MTRTLDDAVLALLRTGPHSVSDACAALYARLPKEERDRGRVIVNETVRAAMKRLEAAGKAVQSQETRRHETGGGYYVTATGAVWRARKGGAR